MAATSISSAIPALQISNQLTELERVFTWLDVHLAPLEQHHVEDAHTNELKVDADEAIANTIHYGYENHVSGKITLRLHIDDNNVTLRFYDDGKAFNPLINEDPDLGIPTEDRETGGLGVLLIRELTDTQDYQYQDGQNILTVTRKRLASTTTKRETL